MPEDKVQHPIYSHIGNKLRQLRKAKGLRQYEVANLTLYTRVSICNIEKGRQAIPVDKLLMFCALYKVSICEFLSDFETHNFWDALAKDIVEDNFQ